MSDGEGRSIVGQLWDVLSYRVVKAEPAFLSEENDSCGRELFCHRARFKDRIARVGDVVLHLGEPESLFKHTLAADANTHRTPG